MLKLKFNFIGSKKKNYEHSLNHLPKRQSNAARVTRPTTKSPGRSRKQASPKKRFRYPTSAINQMKSLQNATHHMIPKAPFSRLVREIMQSSTRNVTMLTMAALVALQESAEIYVVSF